MKMLLLLMMMMVMMKVKADVPPVVAPNDQHYPGFTPIGENCTQSLVELLLLRQEVHMSRQEVHMSRQEEHLSRLLDVVAGVSSTLIDLDHIITTKQHQDTLNLDCLPPWNVVGENCLLFALGESLTWAEGSQYCAGRGGRLAIFHDANTFAEFIGYLYELNAENQAVHAWVGGSDEEVEGVWRWVTGQLMPRGAPFWGTTNNYKKEPGEGVGSNCAFLYQSDSYYMHDTGCTGKHAPLCQKSN